MGSYISKFDIGDIVYRVYGDLADGFSIKPFFVEEITIDIDKKITYSVDDMNKNYYGTFREDELIGDIKTLHNILDAFATDPAGFDYD